MAEKVRICENCGWFTLKPETACPKCGYRVISADYTDIFWNKQSPEEQVRLANEFALEHNGAKVKAISPEEIAAQKAAAEEIARQMREMPHTSTPTFQGYRITRYGGFITGTSTINTMSGIFFTNTDSVESSINAARSRAIENLKKRAFDLDCNAVVGLDVDFVSVDSHAVFNSQADSHYIVVCANGTAVEIEPEE